MTKLHFRACLLIALLCAVTAGRAQVSVDMQLDKSQMLVGEQAELRAIVHSPKNARISFPQFTPGDTIITGLEVVKSERADTNYASSGDRMTVTKRYIITAFDSALYAIPPVEAEVDGQLYKARGRYGLKVVSVPVDTVHVDNFAPPFASLEHPFEWRSDLLLSSLPLFLLIALALFFAIRISMFKPLQKRITLPAPVPPYKAAQEALAEIAQKGFDDNAVNKTFFIELTATLRQYLHGRYGIAAPEQTTEETLREMHDTGIATPEQLLEMRSLLEMADYVKFAREEADAALRRQCYERVMRFLAATKDEAMEHPAPIVQIVTLSGGTQRAAKVLLITGGTLTLLAGIALAALVVYRLYSTFL